jgi:hypothetical protein
MRALYKKPTDDSFHEIIIDNKLEKLQELVGGHIETVTMTMDSCIIVNEEGRILGLPHNCNYLGIDVRGPMLIVGVDGDEFADVPLSVVMANKGIVK